MPPEENIGRSYLFIKKFVYHCRIKFHKKQKKNMRFHQYLQSDSNINAAFGDIFLYQMKIKTFF